MSDLLIDIGLITQEQLEIALTAQKTLICKNKEILETAGTVYLSRG